MNGKRMLAALGAATLFSGVAVAQEAAQPEVSADQLSEHQLKLKLYEFMVNSLQDAKDLLRAGKDLAVEEIPKFAHDYCVWGIIDGLVSAIVWAAAIAAAVFMIRKFIKWSIESKDDDSKFGFGACAGIGTILVIIFVCWPFANNVKQAFKAAYAPRAYIADTLMEKLASSPVQRR